MCVSVIGKIHQIKEKTVIIKSEKDYFELIKDKQKYSIGDYVIAQNGTIVQKLDDEEIKELRSFNVL